ncbi:MAG: hypothetical protein ACLS36_09675 [Streptococcus sp.]
MANDDQSGSDAGYEFCFQAISITQTQVTEMLNQLYYFMNWGQIVFGDKDKDVTLMVSVLMPWTMSVSICFSVFIHEAAYKVNESEVRALANISILEAVTK